MASKDGIPLLFATLAQVFEGDIDCSDEALTQASTDSSSISVRPQVVMYPKNTKDISHIFMFAKEYRLPISVRGLGTSTSGGSLTEGIQINLSRYFTKIHKVDIKNNVAHVDAGISVEKLITRFTELGVRCPILSFETRTSTLGGLVAENATTSASITHGDMRSWISGLNLLLDNGEEHRIEENLNPTGRLLEIYENIHPILRAQSGTMSASHNRMLSSTSGYNVWNQSIGLKQLLDIIVGSEGTLGVITTVTLRVVPLTKHSYTLCTGAFSFSESQKIADIYKHYGCDTLSLSDSSLFKEHFLPEGIKLPSFITSLQSPYLLTGTFIARDEEQVHRITHTCKEKIALQCKELTIEKGITWPTHKDAIVSTIIKNYADKKYSIVTTFDSISLPHDMYASCAEKICVQLNDLGCDYIFGGNIGSDQLSIIFLVDPSVHLGKEILESALSSVTKIVQAHAGSITGGNGDGIIRTPYIGVSSDTHMRNLYREIQQLFDPEQILNAGKKTFLTGDYTTRHTQNPKM